MVKGKSGISAVVATVLIILITIAAVTIIWVAIMPMVKDNISFDEKLVDLTIETAKGYTVWDEENESMSVQVKRGVGDVNLSGIKFIFNFEGTSGTKILNNTPGINQKKTYNFNLSGYGKPTSVSIAPIFSSGKMGIVSSKVAESKIPVGEVEGEIYNIGDGDCSDDADCGDVTSSLICVGNNVTNRTIIPTCSGGVCENVGVDVFVNACDVNELCFGGVCEAQCSEVDNCSSWEDVSCGRWENLTKMLQNRSCDCGNFLTENYTSSSICELLGGAVSWWDFENNAGDVVGENDGSLKGDALVSEGVLVLDGNGDYVEVGNDVSLNIIDNMTLVTLINPSINNGRDYVLTKRAGLGSPNNYNLEIYLNKFEFWVYSGGWKGITSINNIQNNEWSYWAVTYNAGEVNMYNNGLFDSSSVFPPSLIINTRDFSIGGSDTGANVFNGSMDEVLIFNYSLSSEEILDIYNYFS